MRKPIVNTELLTSIDVLNTLNGGHIEARVALQQKPEWREIRVSVPGIGRDHIKVEIHNNYLMVFYTHQLQLTAQRIEVPRVVYNKAIPYFIDADRIEAVFEGPQLVVRMPFNEFSNGYHRSIPTSEG
ncbi:MAG: Hsp20/alpha crystallin family protein [Cyclobacteriaceae bacterium]|jgi:HSP20 family molecular chaperone IbpA